MEDRTVAQHGTCGVWALRWVEQSSTRRLLEPIGDIPLAKFDVLHCKK